jgi:hypothetical protein
LVFFTSPRASSDQRLRGLNHFLFLDVPSWVPPPFSIPHLRFCSLCAPSLVVG